MFQTVLSIECSSELCSVALSYRGKLSVRSKHAPREHAYLVLPFAEALLQEENIGFDAIDFIIFGQGPGAFTGLRVAAAVAQGLALAHDIPLLSGCSLKSLAMQAIPASELIPSKTMQIVSVLDARMSELYWASYEYEEGLGLKNIRPATLSSAEALIDNITSPVFYIGPGCRELGDYLSKSNCLNIDCIAEWQEKFPKAEELLTDVLEFENIKSGSDLQEAVELPMPVYLRNNVAAKAKKPLV